MNEFLRRDLAAALASIVIVIGVTTASTAQGQDVESVGYYVIGATIRTADWRHIGSYDDLESATEEMKRQFMAGKMCTVWVVTIVEKPQNGFEPIHEGKSFIQFKAFDFRDGRLIASVPNVHKGRLRDEIRRTMDPNAPLTVGEKLGQFPGRGKVTPDDQDADGLKDALENELAGRFAPIVFHEADEPNLPTNVDWFLSRTTLRFKVEARGIDELIKTSPTQADLHYVRRNQNGPRARPPQSLRAVLRRQLVYVDSYDCCDREKKFTFYLTDVADADKGGSGNQNDWTTYTHVYGNDRNGVTIQYWRFYAFNTGKDFLVTRLGSHGGDWEGLHVVLDERHAPVEVVLLGHTGITVRPWSAMRKEGTHPKVFAGWGSHPTEAAGDENGRRHDTWTTGRLLNVGEKMHPLNGQTFIGYSGIWGSPGEFTWTSGYWGPAFNETGESNGFTTAWCRGMNQRRTTPEECNCCAPDFVRGRL